MDTWNKMGIISIPIAWILVTMLLLIRWELPLAALLGFLISLGIGVSIASRFAVIPPFIG